MSEPKRISRRQWGHNVGTALAAGSALLSSRQQVKAQTPPARRNPGPPLDVAEWSYFWVGVERVRTARGSQANGMQTYVEYWIPAQLRHPFPLVLIAGNQGQGTDWLSTPDGRRGWATLLLQQGYAVYLVDRPGQGRPPYFPWFHGLFEDQAPTAEGVSKTVASLGAAHTQWPSSGASDDGAVWQLLASQGPSMGRGPIPQAVWRSRAPMLLDEIGPATLVTHGDSATFAFIAAQERPKLVKGIVAIDPPAASLQGLAGPSMSNLSKIPILCLTGEASPSNAFVQNVVNALKPTGADVEQLKLAEHGIRGNGSMPMLEKNNDEVLATVTEWIARKIPTEAPINTSSPPTRNRESLALKLADQGCFWVGVNRKRTTYGAIAEGQTYVQYMIPADLRQPYPIVMVHGGGGQGMHMMGIGRRPGWVHYFVQAGYAVYWIDRPGFGRSPYHPDALGPSHLRNVPAYEQLVASTAVFNTAQWPGKPEIDDYLVNQFMACEVGNVSDEAYHSELCIRGGVELLDRIGPCILFTHAFGGFWGWLMADRRPNLVKAIAAMEINGNPFAQQLRWGLTAAPMTYDPPVSDPSQFRLVDAQLPPDSPRPLVQTFKLQAEPARKWKNLKDIPIAWMTSEFGGGGSANAQVGFLKQAGCDVDLLRLRDYGIHGNANLMLLEKNNHEVFALLRDWYERTLPKPRA